MNNETTEYMVIFVHAETVTIAGDERDAQDMAFEQFAKKLANNELDAGTDFVIDETEVLGFA